MAQVRSTVYFKRALIGALLSLCAAPFSLQAQDSAATRARLDAIEAELKAREDARARLSEAERAAESEAKRLSEELVTLGLRVRAAEVDALRLETQIEVLQEQADEKEAALSLRESELTGLVAALTSLGRRPAAMALLRPGEAVSTARSAAVMGRLVPAIKARAEELAIDLTALSEIRQELSSERFTLKNTLERLARNQSRLGDLVAERRQEARRARTGASRESQRLAELGRQASDLRALLERLEEDARRAADAARARGRQPASTPPAGFGRASFGTIKGRLPLPLSGRVIRRFGEREGPGSTKGITIKGRSGAQAVAPADGQVVFAGPYRGYGRLLIIAHGDGYHSLLAGLDQLYGEIGQWVLAGEPVGAVALSGADAGELYLELREGGSPVDPAAWIAPQALKPAAAD